MDNEEIIFNEFKNSDLSYIDAINRLEKIGYTSTDAEELVDEWEEGIENASK